MEYKTRQWHEKCFSCCVCKNPIGTKSFIPKEQVRINKQLHSQKPKLILLLWKFAVYFIYLLWIYLNRKFTVAVAMRKSTRPGASNVTKYDAFVFSLSNIRMLFFLFWKWFCSTEKIAVMKRCAQVKF